MYFASLFKSFKSCRILTLFSKLNFDYGTVLHEREIATNRYFHIRKMALSVAMPEWKILPFALQEWKVFTRLDLLPTYLALNLGLISLS